MDNNQLVSKMNTLCVSAENEIIQLKEKIVLNLKDYIDDKRTFMHTLNTPKNISQKKISDKLSSFSPKRRLSPSSDELGALQESKDFAKKLVNRVNRISKNQDSDVSGKTSTTAAYKTHTDNTEEEENGERSENSAFFGHGNKLQKYYHVFTQEELRNLIGSTKKLKIIDQYFDKRNWVFVVRKIC